ncbi:hypothetical protein [Actinomyces succiniciruminis]|uniref:Uncharacterized protein n=1 Tax=Actinomyces succiniciruminis TaxID=1522002 RepID=A0A1L7RLU0_9ACTO|nr:hypothetical protein [Actinomyces succiniciruminis]CED90592.1 Hypothetical protein AAM4_0760 [Actinomyces succiniciruminis]
MARTQSYKARHKAERRRVLDVVRGLLRLAGAGDKTAEEVTVR